MTTIAGREAEIEQSGSGWWFISTTVPTIPGRTMFLRDDGYWHVLMPKQFDSREAAQAFIDQHADKPTPPADCDECEGYRRIYRPKELGGEPCPKCGMKPTPPAEPHADAGKMVAVGEGRELQCVVCSASLMPPNDPPHCEDCVVTDEIRCQWEDVIRREHPTTTADTERLRAVEAWIRSRHNGYAPEARKAMDLKEPGSLIEAMEQLEQEHEQLFSAAVEAQVAAEAELTALREQLAAAERERDAAEAKSKPRYYVMESLGKHWLVRDVPSLERSVLHEDGEWSNGGAYRAVSGLKYFDSKEAAEAEIARIQAEAASAKGG